MPFSFFVILVIYLVAGILFMKYKRGATGKEVIPNIEFWTSLPGLIKVSSFYSLIVTSASIYQQRQCTILHEHCKLYQLQKWLSLNEN